MFDTCWNHQVVRFRRDGPWPFSIRGLCQYTLSNSLSESGWQNDFFLKIGYLNIDGLSIFSSYWKMVLTHHPAFSGNFGKITIQQNMFDSMVALKKRTEKSHLSLSKWDMTHYSSEFYWDLVKILGKLPKSWEIRVNSSVFHKFSHGLGTFFPWPQWWDRDPPSPRLEITSALPGAGRTAPPAGGRNLSGSPMPLFWITSN